MIKLKKTQVPHDAGIPLTAPVRVDLEQTASRQFHSRGAIQTHPEVSSIARQDSQSGDLGEQQTRRIANAMNSEARYWSLSIGPMFYYNLIPGLFDLRHSAIRVT